MTHAAGQLRVSVSRARLDVTINRPQARNALSLETLRELTGVFTRFAAEPDIKVAVLSGAGDRAFAAGGDLKELKDLRTAEAAGRLFDTGRETVEAVRRFPVPVVAALNGVALGGGAELATACDFRLAARHAAIGFVQARLGLTTGFGGCANLQSIVGARNAMLLMLRAEVLPAESARAMGLVDMVAAESETLDALVDRFIEPILAHPVDLVRAFKAVAAAGETVARPAVGAVERERFIRAWMSDEHWAASDRLLSHRT